MLPSIEREASPVASQAELDSEKYLFVSVLITHIFQSGAELINSQLPAKAMARIKVGVTKTV